MSYLTDRGRKLLDEVITMLESEWDYCPEVEDLKRIKQQLFGDKSSSNFSEIKNRKCIDF